MVKKRKLKKANGSQHSPRESDHEGNNRGSDDESSASKNSKNYMLNASLASVTESMTEINENNKRQKKDKNDCIVNGVPPEIRPHTIESIKEYGQKQK